jgi:hypothetical protein
MNETIEKNRIARKENARFAEASENLLINLPLLVCGLVMALAIGLEWLG